ncbi:MAG: hypothetical protein Alis3KO_21270 [Aliiglaciecola sp.]
MLEKRKKFWEESYSRNENAIVFPKEEVVKFISRFVRAKQPDGSFIDKIDLSPNMTALDFGCGMGTQTMLLTKFGLNATGVDLSETAINKARQLYPELKNAFLTLNESEILPFVNGYFDIAIAESVLDSMSFELAKINLKEIARVTTGPIFVSLISSKCNHRGAYLAKDETVLSQHEQGTIQSYYDMHKIESLLTHCQLKIQWYSLNQEFFNNENDIENARYYLVLNKR